jgi:carotenoid cleavage dioxygenase-like enzyme
VKERVETLPGFSLMHDMVITQDYYVFFKAPVAINPIKWLLGLAGVASCIEFQDSQPAVAHLIPRNDPSRPRVDIDVDPHFSFHFVRAAVRLGALGVYLGVRFVGACVRVCVCVLMGGGGVKGDGLAHSQA